MLYNLISYIPLILMAIFGVGFLVVFHEFGHFLFAKLFGVYVPSFSIGFGPRLLEKKIGETTFAISAIPLGGYVELAGSAEIGQGEQAHAELKGNQSFADKPYWQKLLIIIGGILFNLIFTYFALSLLFYYGAPCIGSLCNDYPAIIGSTVPNGPAASAHLQPQDRIVRINNTPISTILHISQALKNQANKEVSVAYMREGKEHTTTVKVTTIKQGNKELPRLGLYWYVNSMPLGKAFKEGFNATVSMIKQICEALKTITKNTDSFGGPLALFSEVTKCAGMGFKTFLFMLAFISVNLAVFNVLPLPIFDGGQVVVFTIEALMGRPLSDKARHAIGYYTWIFVLILLVYLTYKDIIKLIWS